jgi:tRNA(His) 5'-end guanylyltransferase
MNLEEMMHFEDLDARMRVFEEAHDHCVMPGIYMVARIDGRGFTKLTKEVHQFEAPYDQRFRDMMLDTIEHLMTCGFNITYAYTQSDEISLLFALHEKAFGRKLRKYESILAGEARAKFSLLLGALGAFDCRISQLPNQELVVDYFQWRQEDAHRNALSGHCYWLLRKQGRSVNEATNTLSGMSTADKNELLWQAGINFNELPVWQRRGMGLHWETYEKEAINRLTGEPVLATRRRLSREMELPVGEAYTGYIRALMEANSP